MAAELLYAIVTALIVGLGFILEIRRERTERERTDPHTEARLVRIEAQDPVRDAMARMAAIDTQLEGLNDRLARFEAMLDGTDEPDVEEAPAKARSDRRRARK
jgi:hypothetical protein